MIPKNRSLQLVNFSKGIRSTEIQNNFDVLQYEIDRERAAVAGPGISYGFDLNLVGYQLKISDGCLIDKDGKEIYIDEQNINIEKPILISKQELKKKVDSNKRVYLSEIPYSNDRVESSNRVSIQESGITVTLSDMTGISSKVTIASIDDKALNLSGDIVDQQVDVVYHYTARRRDVIYIDKNYNIIYRKGITSTSPSVPKIDASDYEYILAYVEVDGMVKQSDNSYIAKVSVIKEFKSVRNIYTDDNNRLFLCGTPFDSIQIIHTTEPKNPKEPTFWYDATTNELKVWRKTDTYSYSGSKTYESSDPDNPQKFETNVKYLYKNSQLSVYVNNKKLSENEYEEGSDLTDAEKKYTEAVYSKEFKILIPLNRYDLVSYTINRYDGYEEWVSLNDKSYIPCEERWMWSPEMMADEIIDREFDRKLFLFDAQEALNMFYTPGKNALKVIIDQIPLHSDQYDEITLYDAVSGPYAEELQHKLKEYYNFIGDFSIENIHEKYENIGIGFMLLDPLDKNCFVEAQVTQRVNANPLSQRFQRSATFIDEGGFYYKEYEVTNGVTERIDPIYRTKAPFRYGENQLEVFLNGRKLENTIDYIELHKEDDLKGASLYEFKLLDNCDPKTNDRITYKVTTNIYSYDHVTKLLTDFKTRIDDIEDIVNKASQTIKDKCDYIDKQINEIDNRLDGIKDIENNLNERFIATDAKLTKDNLSPSVYKGIKDKFISTTYSVQNVPFSIDVTGTCSEDDYVSIYNTTNNRLLQRDSDYVIRLNGNKVELLITSISAENSTLYVSGIKFMR